MKVNGKPTKREIELGIARSAGYHDDARAYTRALVERRTASYAALKAAWNQGARWKAQGIKACTCRECRTDQ